VTVLKLAILIFALTVSFACGYGVREWVSHRRRKEARKEFAGRSRELSALENRITSEINALRDETRNEFAAVRDLLERKFDVTELSEKAVATNPQPGHQALEMGFSARA
jgi:hypothetical protein